MTRIKIEVEFEIDDFWCANSEHQEEREWFWDDVIPSCMVVLHSNEVGDTISQTDSFTIKKISTTAREYTSPVIEELINESNQEKMKQSSIDWLVDEINVHLNFDQRLYLKELLEQAKAMHKEEVMDAHYAPKYGCFNKDYYNQTFNTKEK